MAILNFCIYCVGKRWHGEGFIGKTGFFSLDGKLDSFDDVQIYDTEGVKRFNEDIKRYNDEWNIKFVSIEEAKLMVAEAKLGRSAS
jgi:hypothetical protein